MKNIYINTTGDLLSEHLSHNANFMQKLAYVQTHIFNHLTT